METASPESIPIVLGQEDDGRWWADIQQRDAIRTLRKNKPSFQEIGPARA